MQMCISLQMKWKIDKRKNLIFYNLEFFFLPQNFETKKKITDE